MPCECTSAERTLVLLMPLSGDAGGAAYPELRDYPAGADWEYQPSRGAVAVRVGPGRAWGSAAEVVNFLRTILSAEQLADLKAGWVGGPPPELTVRCCKSSRVQDAEREPSDVRPVLDLAPLDSSPLLAMLEGRRIDTWYQPVFRPAAGSGSSGGGDMELWGHECLMRGRLPDGSVAYPDQILGWARQEHLLFMLDRVCREQHILNAGRAGLPDDSTVLINFLPTAIYEPAFCLRTTEAAARRSGIDRSRIVFEVVESEEVADRDHLATILRHYRDGGYRVALDDVGAGYSGLMMLADLDPDLVKIDRSLVRRAATSRPHRIVCESLAHMAKAGGKLVLAEGIETADEQAAMESIGVDLVQGYRFGRPNPVPATASLTDGLAVAPLAMAA